MIKGAELLHIVWDVRILKQNSRIMIELSKGTVMERRQQLFHERGNWFCRKKVCYHTLVSGSGLKPDVMCFCTAHQDKISFVERIDAAFYDVAGISG